jgi:hypothetical protein
MANKICKDYERLAEDVEIRIEYLVERLEEANPVYFDW